MDAAEKRQEMQQLPKEVKEWPTYEMMLSELTKTIDMCPLFEDLQHESMRQRHWKEIRLEVKDDFDEKLPEFNLERIYGLNLLQYVERITDLTETAKKQLAIEKGLKNIDNIWTEAWDPML